MSLCILACSVSECLRMWVCLSGFFYVHMFVCLCVCACPPQSRKGRSCSSQREVTVMLPNGQYVVVRCDTKSKARDVFDMVVAHANLVEHFYFGLAFLDGKSDILCVWPSLDCTDCTWTLDIVPSQLALEVNLLLKVLHVTFRKFLLLMTLVLVVNWTAVSILLHSIKGDVDKIFWSGCQFNNVCQS